MDSRTPEAGPEPEAGASPEAIDFVRFCRHRRAVGWPELYDEMCAVAGRGLYRGWTADDLSEHGIGFSLFEMPRLAVLVRQVIADEKERSGTSPTVRIAGRGARRVEVDRESLIADLEDASASDHVTPLPAAARA